MAFSERIQQLCPGVNNEQATELCEFLVDASKRLEAEPALMGISLKTLEQEATDQGYAWDTVVMVLEEVAKATSADGAPQQLMEAWQTCLASESSVADFTAVLTDQFPVIKSTVKELVEHAQEERRALYGVAGGTSVGHKLATPWKKNPQTGKRSPVGMLTEVAIAGAIGFGIYSKVREEDLSSGHFATIDNEIRSGVSTTISLPKRLSQLNTGEHALLSRSIGDGAVGDKSLFLGVRESLLGGANLSDLSQEEIIRLNSEVVDVIRSETSSRLDAHIQANPDSRTIPNYLHESNKGSLLASINQRINEGGIDFRRDRILVERDAQALGAHESGPSIGDDNRNEAFSDNSGRDSGLFGNPDFQPSLANQDSLLSQDLYIEESAVERDADHAAKETGSDIEQAASDDMVSAEDDII